VGLHNNLKKYLLRAIPTTLHSAVVSLITFVMLLSFVLFLVIPRQADVAQGVPGRFKAPDFLDVRHYKGGRSSAKRTGRLYPRRNPWYSFSEAESTPGHMIPSGGAAEKISSDTTGNRSQCLNHYATPGPSLPSFMATVLRSALQGW